MESKRQAPSAIPADLKADYLFAILPFLCLLFLIINSCLAIYRSWEDPWSIAFILISLFDLVVLYYILRVFERTPPGSSLRGKLKAAVWFLTTVLTIMFAYRIGVVLSPSIAMVVWSMAAATILGGYSAFFVYKQSDGHRIVGAGDDKNR